MVEEVDDWVEWEGIPKLVSDMTHCTSEGRLYKLLAFTQLEVKGVGFGHQHYRSCFSLLTCPLGRT